MSAPSPAPVSFPANDDDVLDVGGSPRAPWSRRTRRRLPGALVALAVVIAAVVVVVQTHDGPRRPPPVAAPSSAAAGTTTPASTDDPVLVSVNGHDALQPPGLPGIAAQPVVLDPAPAVVAVVAAALPGLRNVRGGRIPGDGGTYGVYLSGTYDGAGGKPISLTIYTERSPGTTVSANQSVTQGPTAYLVRTDVWVFDGGGWWVHATTVSPDDPGANGSGEAARLLPLAENPALVTAA